jgi:2-amino-4-hydroxy-6-hydroxymethyldihydropteridine diphosphokinase
MITCYIALGSNLDNPFKHLKKALIDLASIPQSNVIKCSSFYFTQAMGDTVQDDYLNAVVEFATRLTPTQLLSTLFMIEKQHGRTRTEVRWQARPLDCDILLYGDEIIQTPDLVIPHYGLTERLFVLQPLYEIAPMLRLPDGTMLAEILEARRKYEKIS